MPSLSYEADEESDAAFWLGLRTWSKLTSVGRWELLMAWREDVIPINASSSSSPWRYRIWRDAKLGAEAESFPLHLGEEAARDAQAPLDDEPRFPRDWSQAPFLTPDQMPAEVDSGQGCAMGQVGGWWQSPREGICSRFCLNCVSVGPGKKMATPTIRESYMALRRTTEMSPSLSTPSIPSPTATEALTEEVEELTRRVERWLWEQRATLGRTATGGKEGILKEPPSNAETTPIPSGIDADENPMNTPSTVSDYPTTTTMGWATEKDWTVMEATRVDSLSTDLPIEATPLEPREDPTPRTTMTTSMETTPKPLTFDDVSFDSFDDEDYGTSHQEKGGAVDESEAGSGAAPTEKGSPFNVKGFWDWG